MNYKVIMIDDNPIDHLIVKRICEHECLFADITHLNSANAALDYLKTNGNIIAQLPDIILLNLNMSDQQGWAFLKQFNALYNQLGKVIDVYITTSSLNLADYELAQNYFFVKSFFIKPMSRFCLRDLYKRYAGAA